MGRGTLHTKSNWLIIPHTDVSRMSRLKNAIRRSEYHGAGRINPNKARTRKITMLSTKAKIIPYDTTPIASHRFVRSVNQDISRKAKISVHKWRGKAQIKKRDHSPFLEYLCVMKSATTLILTYIVPHTCTACVALLLVGKST